MLEDLWSGQGTILRYVADYEGCRGAPFSALDDSACHLPDLGHAAGLCFKRPAENRLNRVQYDYGRVALADSIYDGLKLVFHQNKEVVRSYPYSFGAKLELFGGFFPGDVKD